MRDEKVRFITFQTPPSRTRSKWSNPQLLTLPSIRTTNGAHTMAGLQTRTPQRLLALAAALWHNWQIGEPGRHLTAYDH